jgi:hypothetical protein
MLPNMCDNKSTYLAASCVHYQNLQSSLLVTRMIELFVYTYLTALNHVDDSPYIFQMFAPHDSYDLSQNGMFDPLYM